MTSYMSLSESQQEGEESRNVSAFLSPLHALAPTMSVPSPQMGNQSPDNIEGGGAGTWGWMEAIGWQRSHSNASTWQAGVCLSILHTILLAAATGLCVNASHPPRCQVCTTYGPEVRLYLFFCLILKTHVMDITTVLFYSCCINVSDILSFVFNVELWP